MVFVAGVQRSGTNMIMDVLEKSIHTDVYHERDARAFDNYQMRPVAAIRALYDRSPAAHFVIKALCELQKLDSLMSEFRPSKVVWVVRDFEDVVNSMLKSFRNQAKQVQRIARDPASDGWRGEGMSRQTHEVVARLVRPDIDDASAAALTWYFRNILFFEKQFEHNPDVLLVSYERLVTDPEIEFRRLFHFLGLEFTARVTHGIFADSVRKKTAPQIAPEIRELCQCTAERFRAAMVHRGTL